MLALNNVNLTRALFVDIWKAFDTVQWTARKLPTLLLLIPELYRLLAEPHAQPLALCDQVTRHTYVNISDFGT